MRYQIYLDKETSEIINTCAEHDNQKPATLIKQLLESMFHLAKATEEQTRKDFQNEEITTSKIQ